MNPNGPECPKPLMAPASQLAGSMRDRPAWLPATVAAHGFKHKPAKRKHHRAEDPKQGRQGSAGRRQQHMDGQNDEAGPHATPRRIGNTDNDDVDGGRV